MKKKKTAKARMTVIVSNGHLDLRGKRGGGRTPDTGVVVQELNEGEG